MNLVSVHDGNVIWEPFVFHTFPANTACTLPVEVKEGEKYAAATTMLRFQRLLSRSAMALKSPAIQLQRRGMAFQKSFHVDSPDNNASTTFDFTPENYERVFQILAKYPDAYKRAAMIPLLDLAQRQNGGFLPIAAMHKVASICECPPARVYEVASFYTMFNRTPVGKYFIQLCGTTPCMICGSEDIKNAIKEEIGISNGETTADGKFTLLEVECLGACANAPMIQLNDDYYECLTPETMKELLRLCAKDQPPPMGQWGSLPMNGQVSCEGPQGKTSLFEPPTPPKVDSNRFADGQVDPASVKEHMAY